jgi:hypothetical protein
MLNFLDSINSKYPHFSSFKKLKVGVVMRLRAKPWVKALFVQSSKLVPPPPNDIEVPAHFLDE